MNNKILFFSRPLSNTLNEGSKNLVYYICKESRDNLIVFCDKEFLLKLPCNIKIKRLKKAKGNNDEEKQYKISFTEKLLQLKEVLKFWNYTVLNSFFSLTRTSSLLLLIVKYLLRKKIFLTLPTISDNSVKDHFVKLILKRADLVIVLSTFSKNKISFLNKFIFHIPPTIDNERYLFLKTEAEMQLRKKLNIDSPFIVIIPGEYGRLGMNDMLVEVVKQVDNVLKEVLFIFSFRIKTSNDLIIENDIKQKLKGCKVLFKNTISNYHESAGASDIGFFPVSNMDGKFDLPLALVELMAMGKPVLHTDIAPLNELYVNKEGFCLPNNPKMFSDKIIEIFNSEKLYKEMSEKTLKEAERFLPENVIPKYEAIYEQYI